MKPILFLLIVSCLNISTKHPGKNNNFAVVELFTSEGCSSCPAADKVLSKIQHDYAEGEVYVLAYHVDYWDRLGWKDVFSKPEYSARQRQYAKWFNLSSVYTPQVVVNGATELVGSKELSLRSIITSALTESTPDQFELKPIEASSELVTVAYTMNLQKAATSLVLNLVEKTAITKVLRGENKGRDLAHVQIVREQQIISSGKSGTASFHLPENSDKKDYEVIAFLQNNTTGKITGAGRTQLLN